MCSRLSTEIAQVEKLNQECHDYYKPWGITAARCRITGQVGWASRLGLKTTNRYVGIVEAVFCIYCGVYPSGRKTFEIRGAVSAVKTLEAAVH